MVQSMQGPFRPAWKNAELLLGFLSGNRSRKLKCTGHTIPGRAAPLSRDNPSSLESGGGGCDDEVDTKALAAVADNRAMEREHDPWLGLDHPLYRRARAVAMAVGAIRKAQGKPNHEDLTPDSPEFLAAEESFVRDLLRAAGAHPDEPWDYSAGADD
jgi:hypothetical protein